MKPFTKQELIGLFIIFLVLVGISVPNFALSIKRSRDLTRKDDLFALDIALREYEKKSRSFPIELSSLSLSSIPQDPQSKYGVQYLYFSNGKTFQIYGSLEIDSQDEYDETVVSRNLICGTRPCNFGRSYGQTPLDKSIEEYENELYAQP